MTLSEEAQIAIELSLRDARERRHEYAGLEHLLAALLTDEAVHRLLTRLGADVGELRQELLDFLSNSVQEFAP